MREIIIMLSLVILLVYPSKINGKAAIISLEKAVKSADCIVVAKVESIEVVTDHLGNSEKYANAQVIEIWKGNVESKLRFVARPTWTCDASRAEVGETVLLFLSERKTQPISYSILNSGHGRIPITWKDGIEVITQPLAIEISEEFNPTIKKQIRLINQDKHISLDKIRNIVLNLLA